MQNCSTRAISIWEQNGSKCDGNCSEALPDLKKALKELKKIDRLLKLENRYSELAKCHEFV